MYHITNLFLIFSLFFNIALITGQTLSGRITGNETWRGTVTLTGDVVVAKSGRLTILPGTTVKFLPKQDDQVSGYDKNLIELIIEGELIADGSQNAAISFTSAATEKTMGDWFGIVIQNRKSTTSIRNAIVEYGFDGVTVISSKPNIFSNIIQYNFNSGITCKIKARPKIYDNTIFANGWAGVFIVKKAKPILSGNRISLNDYGVIIMKSGEANLGNLEGRGVENNPGQNLIIGNNTYAMDNHSKYSIYAQNNTWAGPDNVPAQDVSDLIFDAKDNPGSGEVIFLPVFGEGQQPIAANQQLAQQNTELLGVTALENQADQTDTANNQLNEDNLLAAASGDDNPDALSQQNAAAIGERQTDQGVALLTLDNALSNNVPEETGSNAEPEVSLEEPAAKEVVVKSPPVRKGPSQEWQIDQRRRQYAQKRPQPEYPLAALQTKTKGQVIVELIADEKGKVISSRILKSDSEVFNEAAVQAANRINYEPMTINGEPVQVKLIERYIFDIR